MFPQLPVLAKGESFRLDLLIGVKLGKRKFWVNGEVDGTAHDVTQDAQRAAKIDLPRVRLTAEDTLAPDCVERLIAQLTAL